MLRKLMLVLALLPMAFVFMAVACGITYVPYWDELKPQYGSYVVVWEDGSFAVGPLAGCMPWRICAEE
jgi:hypothetical protein